MWKFYIYSKFTVSFTFQWIGRWRKWEKGLKNDSSVKLRDVNTSFTDNKLSAEDNAAKC